MLIYVLAIELAKAENSTSYVKMEMGLPNHPVYCQLMKYADSGMAFEQYGI